MNVYVAPYNRILGVHAPGTKLASCEKRECAVHTSDWRAAPRSPENTHGVRADLSLTSLEVALTTIYTTEAHIVGYALASMPEAMPRFAKDSLAWVREQGDDLVLNYFMADWDTPGHIPWTPELLDRLHTLWNSAAGPLAMCGLYLSPKGARLIQPLDRPYQVEEAEQRLHAWLDELVAVGVDPSVRQVKDWTRMMRTPRHRRLSGENITCPKIDIERMQPIAPPAPKSAPRRAVARRSYRTATSAPEFTDAVPAGWEIPADAIGAALRDSVRANWRRAYLALAGALCNRGCPLDAIPAVIARAHRVDQSYENWDALTTDRVDIARATVLKFAAGDRSILGYQALRSMYPAVADALDAHTTSGVELRILQQLARPAPVFVDVVTAVLRIEEIIAKAYGVVLIAAPPGVGKTTAVVARARALPAIGLRAAPGSRIGISAPTHRLARQIATKVPALHLFSPASHLTNGEPTCVYAESARHLAAGRQSTVLEFCEGRRKSPCEYLDTCQARPGREGNPHANMVVGVHALVRQIRATIGSAGTLVVDEPGDATFSVRVELDEIETARRYLDSFAPTYAAKVAPALYAWEAWVREIAPVDGPLTTMREAIRASVDAIPDEILAEAGIDPAADLRDAVIDQLVGAIPPDAHRDVPPLVWSAVLYAKRNPARADELGRASAQLDLLRRGVISEPAFAVRVHTDRIASVVGLNDDLLEALAHEGPVVILDANAALHAPAIAKVFGAEPVLHEIFVRDSAPIERVILACGTANRSNWIPRGAPNWEAGILSALRHVVAWLNENPETHRVGLIVPAVIEAALVYALDPSKPVLPAWKLGKPKLARAAELLRPILADYPGEIRTAHYGGLEGLDFLADCDATVTLLDPRPNLADVGDQAEYLGLDRDGRLDALAAAELEQAHGRLRTIHRTRPGRQLHVGAVVPHGWREVEVRRLSIGRPPKRAEMSAEEFREARGAMTQEEIAMILKCSVAVVKNIEAGRRPVSHDMVCRLALEGIESTYKNTSYRGFQYHDALKGFQYLGAANSSAEEAS